MANKTKHAYGPMDVTDMVVESECPYISSDLA